jgi:hypothetical protein
MSSMTMPEMSYRMVSTLRLRLIIVWFFWILEGLKAVSRSLSQLPILCPFLFPTSKLEITLSLSLALSYSRYRCLR